MNAVYKFRVYIGVPLLVETTVPLMITGAWGLCLSPIFKALHTNENFFFHEPIFLTNPKRVPRNGSPEPKNITGLIDMVGGHWGPLVRDLTRQVILGGWGS